MANVILHRSGEMLLIGLMSGTSLDGVDACLVRLLPAARPQLGLLGWRVTPYSPELRERLSRAVLGEASPAEVACLHAELGYQFAAAAGGLLKEFKVDADQVSLVGSHGHTIYHDPERRQGHFPVSWQIGEAAVIAAETGITTVANFRPADVALDGQGAPLVAWFDHFLFGRWGRCMALQNLGGIANVTALPGDGDLDRVLAFDTGPGNMVIDRLAELATRGKQHLDRDGKMAEAGTPHDELLERLLTDPYLAQKPPKSTGRERFGHRYADRIWMEAQELHLSDEDVLATVTEFTARTITDAYVNFIMDDYPLREIVVSGGGAHNRHLLRRIREYLSPIPVTLIDRYGIPADIKEAVAFAVLAYAAAAGRPNNVPGATGASRPAILGQISPGRNYRRTRLALPHVVADRNLPVTEQRHPLTHELDTLDLAELLELMNREDGRAVDAVAHVLPLVEEVVGMAHATLARGGRLFYVGAGTSGRLGNLDAVECPPTFYSEPRQVQAIVAGGQRALVGAVEGAEDSEADGAGAMREHSVGERDLVIGITASGTTPFVRAALKAAKEQGARTVLICSTPLPQHDAALDLAIEVPTGPEVLTGSTRLKAGTAAKLILNMISTAAMVRLGKAYSNLMVDVHATNDKLRRRALRIIQTLTPLDEDAARKLLDQARGRVKIALVMHKRELDYEAASDLLRQHDGFLRPILDGD